MFSGIRFDFPRFVQTGFLFFLVALTSAHAQNAGEIRLQVNDPSGAALQASGRVTGPGTHRTFQTDAKGAFSLSGLPFGSYRLDISRTGFAAHTITVDVSSTAPISQQVTLHIQSASASVTVFSPTPIGQADQSLDEIPVPVQGLTEKNLEDSNALDLADLMNKRLTSVFVNDNVGNPYQPDINYRGYTASLCWEHRKGSPFIWTACVKTSRSATLWLGI